MDTACGIWLWKVRCIDEDSRMLFDRELIFDPPTTSSAEEVAAALAVLRSNGISLQTTKFRHLFREISKDEMRHLFAEIELGHIPSMRSGCVTDDYFETKAGRPIDTVELIEIQSGKKNPIILGDPRSVLRLGPSNLLKPGSWDLQKSNDLAHYLQISSVIRRSEWLRGGASIENFGQTDERFEGPSLESTTAALILMRQFLPGADNSFLTACRIYCEHVDDERKRQWVEIEMRRFEVMLEERPTFDVAKALAQMNHGEIVELFVYGTGLIHRQSRKNLEDALSTLHSKHSRREIVFGFHWVAHCFLQSPLNVAPVLYADFTHWIHHHGVPRPTRVASEAFFATDPATTKPPAADPLSEPAKIRIRV